jgi:uncharacterized protein YraI/TM2 domain-containing membrane protein YozV
VVLSIFLGGLGADRFYAGRTGLGVVKILSNFVGIGFIWWLIDIYLALTGKQLDGNGDYITRGTSSGGCLGKLVVLLIIVGVLGGGVYFAWNYIGPIASKLTGLTIGSKTSSTTAEATATVTSDAANFRTGPSTSHDIIKTLKKGDTLTVTGGIENGWAPVKHGSDTGWVSAELIGIASGGQTSTGQKQSAVQTVQQIIGTWIDDEGNQWIFDATGKVAIGSLGSTEYSITDDKKMVIIFSGYPVTVDAQIASDGKSVTLQYSTQSGVVIHSLTKR